MNTAAFNFRQWSTNSEILTAKIQSDGLQTKSDVVRVLGLKWDTQSDQLSIAKNDVQLPQKLTKRIATSQAASTFDPLGLIAPLIVPAKSYVNKMSIEDKNWDEKLSPKEYVPQWQQIRQNSL
jgi:hypothetical protein